MDRLWTKSGTKIGKKNESPIFLRAKIQIPSFLVAAAEKNQDEFTLPHPIWSEKEVDSVEITHRKPKGFVDHMAYYSVMAMRTGFDFASGYTIGKSMKTLDERSVLIRCIFLETVAGKYFCQCSRF